MAIVAVLIPLALLAVVVALGRYEELMLPPSVDEPEGHDGAAPAREAGAHATTGGRPRG